MKPFSHEDLYGASDLTPDDILLSADENQELSEPLSRIIDESKKIFVIVGEGVLEEVLNQILYKCREKLFSIVIVEQSLKIDSKYSDKILNVQPSHIEDYKYFGVTNSKTPLLIHKCLVECDGVIALSSVKYDSLRGFRGCPGLIFPHLAAEKSQNIFWRKALDFDAVDRISQCSCGELKGNPLDKDMKEAIVTLSSGAVMFGIHMVSASGAIRGVFCGDILLSYVRACEAYAKYNTFETSSPMDGLIIETTSFALQEIVSDIEASVSGLMKGGRLLIKAPSANIFGSVSFRSFFDIHSLSDVFGKVAETDFPKDAYDAFLLKKIASQYNLGIISALDYNDLIQCGMNPVAEKDAEDFLKNCSNIGRIFNAARFTISQ